ncbi:hypothetical protein L484_003181 [Morus notabilis]|uniref:Uncharacterized protein n=1 Tax=Morus notabilis TaxID=981085 RepID=W9RIT8_9ROSA|nr:hypothetical protein L484_003181 [Morus notabilis]
MTVLQGVRMVCIAQTSGKVMRGWPLIEWWEPLRLEQWYKRSSIVRRPVMTG